jgi:hypothetical protein
MHAAKGLLTRADSNAVGGADTLPLECPLVRVVAILMRHFLRVNADQLEQLSQCDIERRFSGLQVGPV